MWAGWRRSAEHHLAECRAGKRTRPQAEHHNHVSGKKHYGVRERTNRPIQKIAPRQIQLHASELFRVYPFTSRAGAKRTGKKPIGETKKAMRAGKDKGRLASSAS
jgi:hypothetical protein